MTGGKKVREKTILVNTPVELVIRTFNGQVVDTATQQTTPQDPPGGAGPVRARRRGSPGEASLGISVHISAKSGVVFYPKGIQTIAPKRVMGKSGGKVFERGKVTSFSAHSRGRLRRVLMSWASPDGWLLAGGSLTVPGPSIDGDTWRKAFKALCCYIEKRGACAIWRIELQTKKRIQPHAHVTVWAPTKEIIEDIFNYWFKCIDGMGEVTGPELKAQVYTDRRAIEISSASSRMALVGASEHCLDWSFAKNDMAGWWRYLCDHSSKKKESQLGWQGRQWGVVGRAHFEKLRGDFQQLSDAEFARVLRVLRRLSRPADPMKRKFWRWGKLRGKRGNSDWFSSPETLRRAVEWARSESVNQQGEI